MMLIKGMSVVRSENDSNYDYLYVPDLENEGLRQYTHRYFSGLHHYYFSRDYLNAITENIDEDHLDKDLHNYLEFRQNISDSILKQQKKMHQNEFRMLLRVVLVLTKGELGTFKKSDGRDCFGNDYTGNHIAVFEC